MTFKKNLLPFKNNYSKRKQLRMIGNQELKFGDQIMATAEEEKLNKLKEKKKKLSQILEKQQLKLQKKNEIRIHEKKF